MSTDSEEIMNLASQYVEIIHRPPELGADDTLHLPVVQHAVNFLQDFGYYAPYTCILQATSPCVQPFHFVEAKNLMVESNADSVISVAKVPKNFSPYKAVELKDGRLKLLFGEIRNRGILRQNLPETYWNPGLVYLFKTRLLEENTFYGNHVIPLFIDDKYTIDINVPEDLEKAEKRLIELNLKFDHI